MGSPEARALGTDHPTDTERLVTPTQYLHAFARFRWLVLALVILGVGSALVLGATAPTTYRSSTNVVLSLTRTAGETASEAYSATLLGQQRMATYADIAQGPTLVEQLDERLDLPLTATQLADRIEVSVPASSTVATIVVRDTNRERTELIATTAASALVDIINTQEDARGRGNALLRAKVLTPAREATSASAPPAWRNPILAGVGGLLLGLGVAVLGARLDPRVRDESAVADELGVPVLGVVPARPQEAFEKAIDELRSTIFFLRADGEDDGGLTLAVTSPHPIDLGPLTDAVAAALAETGARVLLVDADLEQARGRPSEEQGDVAWGLAGLLTGAGSFDEVLGSHMASGVEVVPAGQAPAIPAEPLHSAAFARFLQGADSDHDFVLVVSAPTSTSTDPLAVAARCDGTLLVTARNRTSRKQVSESRRQLERVGARIVGAVLLS